MIQRLKKGINSLKPKYIITELLLLIVGINVGLWFNNLNEDRKDRDLEHKILVELKASLESDKEDIVLNLLVHEQAAEACDKLLFKREQIHNKDLSNTILSTMGWTYLVADLSTYESLKSIGFQLIEDDEIRRRMIKLYNVRYKAVTETEKNHKRKCDKVEEEIHGLIQFEEGAFVIQEAVLGEIDKFAFEINVLKSSNTQMVELYKNEVLPEIDFLLTAIDKQISE
ncbi:MAG: hypothetical protein AAF348_03450 [Bacteroidota bacterium]